MNDSFRFVYPIGEDSRLLNELLKVSNVRRVRLKSSVYNVKDITGYAHGLFAHDGDNVPSRFDPLTILKEARGGHSFRCVEYSILAAGLLWANGIPARMIGLKTKDVETREYGAGHVAIESWDMDHKKWIMIDVQAGIMPVLGDKYLSAFELKQALDEGEQVTYESVTGSRYKQNRRYGGQPSHFDWIHEYLFFIDTPLELALGNEDMQKQKIVMLVPRNSKPPKSFQKMFDMDAVYTTSAEEFYPNM